MSQITEAYFPSVRTQDEVIHRSVLKAEVYRQQGNCLSAPPLGDLSLLLWYDFYFYCYDHLMPRYDPYVTPIFYASFIYQDSSIMAVYFYYAALTAQ